MMFIKEITGLLSQYADASPLESIAMTAIMTMPALLLQKPQPRSRNEEHIRRLKECLELWKKGDIDNLLEEGQTIQLRLPKFYQKAEIEGENARTFARLIEKGDIKAALRHLNDEENAGKLPLNSLQRDNLTVKEHLLRKHPRRKPALIEAITKDTSTSAPHPVIYEELDGTLIKETVQRMTGSAGPYGLDTMGWKRLCSSFGTASADLCKAIARVARRICSKTCYVDLLGLTSFVACWLIALDKNPGVRPIEVGEILRRIIGKAVLTVTSDDIRRVVGTQQLCARQISGSEAGVHTMRHMMENSSTEAVLLVDASKAFNSLNREAALRNVHTLCPALAPVLINTYREDSPLFIDGNVILSQEETIQGDPLAMPMYAIGTLPLIQQLPNQCKSVWFADDATAGKRLDNIKTWWDSIKDLGPKFGYTPNAEKSWLIVREEALEQAQCIFHDSGINISSQGRPHLGAPLGSNAFIQSFVESKVTNWVKEIKQLATIAKSQPQDAYAALTHGLMGQWTYLMRTVPDVGNLFEPLEDAIRLHLLPAIITGRLGFTDQERKLFALPARHGGLGIAIPSQMAHSQFEASSIITKPLVSILQTGSTEYNEFEVRNAQVQLKKEISTQRKASQMDQATSLKETLPTPLQRSMELASEEGAQYG